MWMVEAAQGGWKAARGSASRGPNNHPSRVALKGAPGFFLGMRKQQAHVDVRMTQVPVCAGGLGQQGALCPARCTPLDPFSRLLLR